MCLFYANKGVVVLSTSCVYACVCVCVRFPESVYNLANGIDVEETRHRVEQYKKENQALIMKNRARLVRLPLATG